MLTNLDAPGSVAAPVGLTRGKSIAMLLSESRNRVPTMKKINNRKTTSIMLVKLIVGVSSWCNFSGMTILRLSRSARSIARAIALMLLQAFETHRFDNLLGVSIHLHHQPIDPTDEEHVQ